MLNNKKIALLLLCLLLTSFVSQANEFVVSGRITDTSDNWLNNAKVFLPKMNISTQTDPNGHFVLQIKLEKEIAPDDKGIIDHLEISAEDHISQKIEIKSLAFFKNSKDLVVKLEPISITNDIIGFKTKMSMAPIVGNLLNKLKSETGYHSASTDIPSQEFQKILSSKNWMAKNAKEEDVEFHVYIPKAVKKVKAAFYISRHGIGNLSSPVLRKFAEKEKVALVGFLGNPVQRGLYPASLLDPYIAKLAELSKHPELSDVPILTFGHSNGTGFSTCFASERPEKVIAWISFHSGYSNYLQFPNTEKVPSLVMHGRLDDWLKHRQDETVKNMRKNRNAAMCMMMEGNVGHGPVNKETTWEFIVQFCTAAMRSRLDKNGELIPVDIEAGWLGQVYDPNGSRQQKLEIAEHSQFKGDKTTANWLIDESFAKIWQAYGLNTPDRKDKPKYLE